LIALRKAFKDMESPTPRPALLGVKEKVTDWAWDFIDLFLLVLGFEN
jgi:hypothetical protein